MGLGLCCPIENRNPGKTGKGQSNFIKKLSKDRYLISFLETPRVYYKLGDNR